MKKTLIIVLLFCAAIMITGLRTGFAFNNYGPNNCKTCHEGAGTVHAQHDPLPDCSACHAQDPPESPATSTCIVCHPGSDPGFCPLVIGHDAAGVVSCLSCHESECGDACPPDTPEKVLEYDEDKSCFLSKEELKTYSDTLKADQKAAKTKLKVEQKEEKDTFKIIKKEYAD